METRATRLTKALFDELAQTQKHFFELYPEGGAANQEGVRLEQLKGFMMAVSIMRRYLSDEEIVRLGKPMTAIEIQDSVSAQIREAIKLADVAISYISQISGISSDTIYRMRHGESLTIKNLHALATALGMVLFVDIRKAD